MRTPVLFEMAGIEAIVPYTIVRGVSWVHDWRITLLSMFEQRLRKSKNVWHTRGLEPGNSLSSLSAGSVLAAINKTKFLKIQSLDRA